MERVMGIEPTLAAWEAAVLPLNYTRVLELHCAPSLCRASRAMQRTLGVRCIPRRSEPVADRQEEAGIVAALLPHGEAAATLRGARG